MHMMSQCQRRLGFQTMGYGRSPASGASGASSWCGAPQCSFKAEGRAAPRATAASKHGWRGVWGPALKGRGGRRSGGTAVLVRQIVRMHRRTCTHRSTSAVVCWTRMTRMHFFSVYGPRAQHDDVEGEQRRLLGSLQENVAVLGRTPWVIGGDWSVQALAPHCSASHDFLGLRIEASRQRRRVAAYVGSKAAMVPPAWPSVGPGEGQGPPFPSLRAPPQQLGHSGPNGLSLDNRYALSSGDYLTCWFDYERRVRLYVLMDTCTPEPRDPALYMTLTERACGSVGEALDPIDVSGASASSKS